MWNSARNNTKWLSTKHQVDMDILDLSKAFDTVQHDTLLHKLHQYGKQGNIHTWFTSFLTAKKMRTIAEWKKSRETNPENSRVPQGTVLGPIIYSYATLATYRTVSTLPTYYSPTTVCYRTTKKEKDHHTLQTDINNLEQLINNWDMNFNAKKCYIWIQAQRCQKLQYDVLQKTKNPVTLFPVPLIFASDSASLSSNSFFSASRSSWISCSSHRAFSSSITLWLRISTVSFSDVWKGKLTKFRFRWHVRRGSKLR